MDNLFGKSAPKHNNKSGKTLFKSTDLANRGVAVPCPSAEDVPTC